jgi:hypothetical protein
MTPGNIGTTRPAPCRQPAIVNGEEGRDWEVGRGSPSLRNMALSPLPIMAGRVNPLSCMGAIFACAGLFVWVIQKHDPLD